MVLVASIAVEVYVVVVAGSERNSHRAEAVGVGQSVGTLRLIRVLVH